MTIAIVIADSNSACPVPAVKGGAVANLVDYLLKENSEKGKVHFWVFSYYDIKACEVAQRYSGVTFSWIKIPYIIRILDDAVFFIISHFFRKKKAMSYRHTFSLIFYVLVVANRLRCNKFDKIVLENNIILSWVLRLFKNGERYKGRVYYHLHNIPRLNAKNQSAISQIRKFICVSQFVCDSIADKNNPIGPVEKERLAVVKNCIDINMFSCNGNKSRFVRSLHEKLKVDDETIIIVFAGRLSKEKGIDKVIKALDYMDEIPVKLIVVGNTLVSGEIGDDFSRKLSELAKTNDGKIVFTGFVNQEEVREYYCGADFAVLPSMWDEPAGLTMIEAMACNTMVISTKSGGIPEYTTNGASILLDRDDILSEKIAEAIKYYCREKEQAKNIANKGRQYVLDNFSTKDYLERFIKALEE